MVNIFIIHGSYGNPEENWIPWLKSGLERCGCKVFVPKFPTPDGQSLQAWQEIFKKFDPYLQEDSIVVGHSLGPAFLLSVLEGLDHPIGAAFFVAGFTGLLDNPNFDEINATFTTKRFDWTRINDNCRKFYVLNSDNDPYVPIEKGKDLASHLNTELILVKGAGHFNKSSGFTKFPMLLDLIKDEIKEKHTKKEEKR